MPTGRVVLTLVAGLAFGLAGCARSNQDQVGGESHWLQACSTDAQCGDGGLVCDCGTCTRACADDDACAGGPAAVCADRRSEGLENACSAMPPPTDFGVCLRACSSDADCSGKCVDGGCALAADDGSQDPTGTPGDSALNPSGSCAADGNGGRFGYHSPDASDVYLPDCQRELEREYWRIFLKPDEAAYMIPRPDGARGVKRACADPEHALHEALVEYTLCDEAARPAAVNAMDVEDAFALSRLLHADLIFENHPEQGASGFPDDILEACQADEAFRTGPMSDRCDFELEAAASGARSEIGHFHTGAEGDALAAKMNDLYGIRGERFCERAAHSAADKLDAALEIVDRACTIDADCAAVAHSSRCHDRCSAAIAAGGEPDIDAARDLANAMSCTPARAADCPDVVSPPCEGLEPACVDNLCRY